MFVHVGTLLTVKDVADELQVSPRTVLLLVDQGKLRAIEGVGRGRGLRFRREWVEAFLANQERRPSLPIDAGGGKAPRAARGRRPASTFTSPKEARAALGLVRGGRA